MAAQKARGDNPRAFSFSSLTCPDAGPCTLEIRCPQESFPRRKGGADFVLLPDLRFAPPALSRRARCRPGEASCVAGRSALYATNSSSLPSRQGGSLYPPGIELGRSGWGIRAAAQKKPKPDALPFLRRKDTRFPICGIFPGGWAYHGPT